MNTLIIKNLLKNPFPHFSFLMFHNYRIPREALLNKTGDVLEDGSYVTPYKDPNKRHGASFGALSMGRVNITHYAVSYLSRAITIALRYAAVRKQFGPGDEEVPILEYQSHVRIRKYDWICLQNFPLQQHRLIPYLAALYVQKVVCSELVLVQYQFAIDQLLGQNKDKLPDLGLELHGISCSSKPVTGWTARDGIQESREACAGHGYLKGKI